MFNPLPITGTKMEAPGIKTFTFDRPDTFQHQPGQYAWLRLEGSDPNHRVPIAIASGTLEPIIMFSIRAWGRLTQELFKLEVGDRVLVSGPQGNGFPTSDLPVLAVAGGTGITPVRSLIHSLPSGKGQVKVYYGARTSNDFLYKEELEKWSVIRVVERPSDNEIHPTGYVTNFLRQTFLGDLSPNTALAFTCGPMPMMKAAIQVIQEKGFSAERIYVSLERLVNGEVVGPVLPASDPLVGFELSN